MAILVEKLNKCVGIDDIIGFIKQDKSRSGFAGLKVSTGMLLNGDTQATYTFDLDSIRILFYKECELTVSINELQMAYKEMFQKLQKNNPCIQGLRFEFEISNEKHQLLNVLFFLVIP